MDPHAFAELLASPLEKVLQLVPMEGVHVHTDAVTDIGLSKSVYYGLFRSAHTYWHSHKQQFKHIQEQPPDTLRTLYEVTIAYMFTTNDNHMMVKCHEAIFYELFSVELLVSEFHTITTLASCKLAKINKNSLLWLLIKKLTVLMISHGLPFLAVVPRVFRACEYHYSNYYANSYLGWLIGLNKALGFDPDGLIAAHLSGACKQHLSDSSLWHNLRVLLWGSGQAAVEEYRRLAALMGPRVGPVDPVDPRIGRADLQVDPRIGREDPRIGPVDPEQSAAEWRRWLDSVGCRYSTPYRVLARCSSE